METNKNQFRNSVMDECNKLSKTAVGVQTLFRWFQEEDGSTYGKQWQTVSFTIEELL